jgi:hypothetical protein
MGELVHISDVVRRIKAQAHDDLESAQKELDVAMKELDTLGEELDRRIASLEALLTDDSETGDEG